MSCSHTASHTPLPSHVSWINQLRSVTATRFTDFFLLLFPFFLFFLLDITRITSFKRKCHSTNKKKVSSSSCVFSQSKVIDDNQGKRVSISFPSSLRISFDAVTKPGENEWDQRSFSWLAISGNHCRLFTSFANSKPTADTRRHGHGSNLSNSSTVSAALGLI